MKTIVNITCENYEEKSQQSKISQWRKTFIRKINAKNNLKAKSIFEFESQDQDSK